MMNKAVLNNELIATKAGDITVYNYDGETREYISTSTEYLGCCGCRQSWHVPVLGCSPAHIKLNYAILPVLGRF